MKITEAKPEPMFRDTVNAVTSNQKDGIELDLEKLIKFGVIERDIKIGSFSITMRTLTDDERDSIMRSVPPTVTDSTEQVRLWRKPTLARAIVRINSVDFSREEDKQKLENILGKLQGVILDKLFMEYLQMLNDQMALMESGSKKNS
jgi:hypothetical protein